MNSYTDIDGVPVAADETLLTGLLRGQCGFEGTVVSDYNAVAFLQKLHGVAGSPAEAATLALVAGIDVELPSTDCYGEPLVDVIEAGALDEKVVDRALERVLLQKCQLGLLDEGWSPDPPFVSEMAPSLDDDESRVLARRLAERGVVLLANNGVLPLEPGAAISVVGPRADDSSAMLGDYSFPQHVGVHHPEVPLGLEIPTVRAALASDPAQYSLVYALGCPVTGGGDSEIEMAVRTAADADLCVAVLGDRAGLFGRGTSGEGCDALDLRLPGRQEELLDALLGTGTPVVLVLLSGRPYDLSPFADRLGAIVCGFYLGEEGAAVLADVLAGRVNPSGRLPVSFPAAGGGQPGTYLAATLAQANQVSAADPTALFPFGHGLGYASATWGEISAPRGAEWPTDGEGEVRVALANEAERATTEVVQVYLHDPVADVARPERKLLAVARVELEPGEQRTARFVLHADLTSYCGRDGRRIVDAGEVVLLVGASSRDIRGHIRLQVTGDRRVVGADRVLEPDVTVK
jgi:beta-xylosidase